MGHGGGDKRRRLTIGTAGILPSVDGQHDGRSRGFVKVTVVKGRLPAGNAVAAPCGHRLDVEVQVS